MESIYSPLSVCAGIWLLWAGYWTVSAWFVNKTVSREGVVQRWMHLGPLALGLWLIFHQLLKRFFPIHALEQPFPQWAGVALTLIGCGFAVLARMHLGRYWSGIITLKEGHQLIRTGPYRIARHPIYTGLFLAAFGSALSAASGEALFGSLMILFSFLRKLRREEALMIGQFGDEYVKFRQEVATIIPFLY